jgi:hypothetical protein
VVVVVAAVVGVVEEAGAAVTVAVPPEVADSVEVVELLRVSVTKD